MAVGNGVSQFLAGGAPIAYVRWDSTEYLCKLKFAACVWSFKWAASAPAGHSWSARPCHFWITNKRAEGPRFEPSSGRRRDAVDRSKYPLVFYGYGRTVIRRTRGPGVYRRGLVSVRSHGGASGFRARLACSPGRRASRRMRP